MRPNWSLLGLTLILGGCGAGHQATLSAGVPPATVATAGPAAATSRFTIAVPNADVTASAGRRPRWISPNTVSVDLTFTFGGNTMTTSVPLAGCASAVVGQTTQYTCSGISAPIGSNGTVSATAFGSTAPARAALSTTTISGVTIPAGGTTLDFSANPMKPVVAQVVVTPNRGAKFASAAQSVYAALTYRDGYGNTISSAIGTFANPVSVTATTASSPYLAFATSSTCSPTTTTVTLTSAATSSLYYCGTNVPANVAMNATFTPAAVPGYTPGAVTVGYQSIPNHHVYLGTATGGIAACDGTGGTSACSSLLATRVQLDGFAQTGTQNVPGTGTTSTNLVWSVPNTTATQWTVATTPLLAQGAANSTFSAQALTTSPYTTGVTLLFDCLPATSFACEGVDYNGNAVQFTSPALVVGATASAGFGPNEFRMGARSSGTGTGFARNGRVASLDVGSNTFVTSTAASMVVQPYSVAVVPGPPDILVVATQPSCTGPVPVDIYALPITAGATPVTSTTLPSSYGCAWALLYDTLRSRLIVGTSAGYLYSYAITTSPFSASLVASNTSIGVPGIDMLALDPQGYVLYDKRGSGTIDQSDAATLNTIGTLYLSTTISGTSLYNQSINGLTVGP